MAAMHVLPHIHTMNPSYAHIDPAASLLAAAHPEAGPSYTRTSPRTQPAPVQTYGNVAQDWEYFESADGANTGGTSPSGSSVGTPVSDAALSHPQIVGSEPYQTEKFPALTYPSYEQWMYDAPPPAPSKSSLHGAVGDTYTYAADDREAVLVAASAYTGAGSAQASSSSHLAPANYAGASAQVPAYYPTHPPSYTGQRTVTVSYTVNVTARAPYAASRHPQAQAQGQMHTHQPLLPAPVYHHHHPHPHQQQQQMQAYPQMLTAHHHHHPHQYQPHQQQHQHAYVPALAQTQPQQHHHLPAPTTSYQHHPSYQPPVPQAASFAPELPPLYHPKPQHSLPEWVHDQSVVCPEEPRWDGPQIEAAPSEEEADEMDDDDESGDEDGDEDDDGDDGESDDAGEEMQDMVVDMCAGVQEGTLPPSSLLCQPISDSVRAQFAAVAAPPRTVPVAPAQRMYWH